MTSQIDNQTRQLAQAIDRATAAIISLNAWLQASASASSTEKRLLKALQGTEERIMAALDPVLKGPGAAALAKVRASRATLAGATERVDDAAEKLDEATPP